MGLLTAELRKLTSVRTTVVITLVGMVLVGFGAGFFLFESELSGEFTGTDAQVAAAIDQIGGMSIVVLVMGLLVTTTEFRHDTIGRTLQLTPGRTRVMAAKLVVGALYGIVFFVLGLALVTLLVLLAGGEPTLGSQTRTALWHGPAGLALTAVFGVAVGALLRNQVVAVTVSLLYVMLFETLVNQFLPELARWLPFQALNALFLSDEVLAGAPEGMVQPLEASVALPVFLGYVLAATVAGVALLRVRDV